jgi:hypothetical protein
MNKTLSTLIGASALTVGLLAFTPSQAQAAFTLTFDVQESTNGQENIPLNAITANVTDTGSGALFTFSAAVPTGNPNGLTSLAAEQFGWYNVGTLLGTPTTITNSISGVTNFVNSTPPPNGLPDIPGSFTLATEAQNITGPGGGGGIPVASLNLGETFSVLLSYQTGVNFAQVQNAFSLDRALGGAYLGTHVISINGGGSEAFTTSPVPEPLTLLGSGIALGFGGYMKRKLGQSKKA